MTRPAKGMITILSPTLTSEVVSEHNEHSCNIASTGDQNGRSGKPITGSRLHPSGFLDFSSFQVVQDLLSEH